MARDPKESSAFPAGTVDYYRTKTGAGHALIMAAFCFRSSSRLWGRFDFQSVLVWVEMEGTYQTASIGTGNNFRGKLQSSNRIVRSESMTLRVWRARIESVVSGKDSTRQVTPLAPGNPRLQVTSPNGEAKGTTLARSMNRKSGVSAMNLLVSSLVASVMLLAGCSGGNGNEYLGKWVNTKSEKRTLQIERNGDAFIVRATEPGFVRGELDTKNLPATLKDGVLQVQTGGFGPINFMVDKATGNLTSGQAEYKKAK